MAQTLDSLALDIRLNVSGLAEVQQVQRRMQGMDRQIKSSTGAINQYSNAHNRAGRNVQKFTMGVLQQAGYQIGDYYVQVANGTNAMQAFGQQGAQLLGIFGPIGAVLGAGVAIYSAYAVASERAAAATENLTGAQEDLLEVLREMEGISLGEDLFANLSNQAIAELEPLRQFLERGLTEQVRAQFQSVREEIASGVTEAAQQQFMVVEQYRSLLEDLEMQAEQQGMTEGIRLAMEEIRSSISGANEELDRQRQAMTIIEGISGRTRQEFVESFATAVRRLETEELITDELNQSLFAFAQANGLAGVLAELLSDAAESANRMASSIRVFQQERMRGSGRGGDPRDFYGDRTAGTSFEDMNLEEADVLLGLRRPPRSAGSGGARAEQKTIQDVIQEQERRIAQEVELLSLTGQARQLRQIQINLENAFQGELDETGRLAIEQASQRIAAEQQVRDELQKAIDMQSQLARAMENAMTGAFMSITDGTKSAADAFKDMARLIIAELYRVLVVQRLVGSFTPGEGGTGIVGSIMGALGFRAMGGPMTANRPYVVGERGPELVVPSRNGTVVPNNQLGGQQPIVVNYTFQGGVTEADLARALPTLVQRTKREIVDAVQRGGSMSRAFG